MAPAPIAAVVVEAERGHLLAQPPLPPTKSVRSDVSERGRTGERFGCLHKSGCRICKWCRREGLTFLDVDRILGQDAGRIVEGLGLRQRSLRSSTARMSSGSAAPSLNPSYGDDHRHQHDIIEPTPWTRARKDRHLLMPTPNQYS